MLTPFMPCCAKLPVIALFAGAFFAGTFGTGFIPGLIAVAVMIGIVGYYKYLEGDFCAMDLPAFSRTTI
jgi:Fe2+ transport system protein B